jgi:hypothetical protein
MERYRVMERYKRLYPEKFINEIFRRTYLKIGWSASANIETALLRRDK